MPNKIDWQKAASPAEAVDKLILFYSQSATALRKAFKAFVEEGRIPPGPGHFGYPSLRIVYAPDGVVPAISLAFGTLKTPGIYEADIAHPALYKDYLIKQLSLLVERYDVDIFVSISTNDIPYPFVLENTDGVDAETTPPAELARYFPIPDLAVINNDLADGYHATPSSIVGEEMSSRPLSLFSALRTDYSLQRLKHYTGTNPEDFQKFILFTNYHRYMDEFVQIGLEKLQGENGYQEFVAPGGVRVKAEMKGAASTIQQSPWRQHQMPAYHLTAPDGGGITLVNIGVGPSNAKTITDHLAVLRPQCWIMVGHCGGLRHSQRLGDYVLAHAYLRLDGVLDSVLPPDIPVPPIAEVQLALNEAATRVTGDDGHLLKQRLRTGTVVTQADRNWELRFRDEARTLDRARAVAIDMESATIAANGYRYRVPYGTLLCVSDKPLHGEIKLPGAANRFYERAIEEHMKIGIEALEIFRREGASSLHSRKLRSFDEPPFR